MAAPRADLRDDRPTTSAFWLGRLDARPLAVFRIVLGAIVLFDLGDRLRDFHAFYTDLGLVERSVLTSAVAWSAAGWMGESWQAGVVFALGALGAVGLVLGFKTRWSTLLTFWAVLSIQERNLAIFDGGDQTLRLLLFWSIFVDLGARYSLDARRGRQDTIAAVPVRLLQLQVVLIHFFAGVSKNGATWKAGTAVFRAMQDRTFGRSGGEWLLAYPTLCTWLTYGTLAIEICFPFLVCSPWLHSRLRAFAVGAALLLHLGIFSLMRIGMFSFVMPLSLLALVRAAWWPAWRRTPPVADEGEPQSTMASRWIWFPVSLAVLITWTLAAVQTPALPLRILRALGLQQQWKLFAPDPAGVRRTWYVPGVLGDGQLVDVGAEIAPRFIEDYPVRYTRWAKWKSHLAGPGIRRLDQTGRYLCRLWKGLHPDGPALVELDLEYATEPVVDPGQTRLAATMTRALHQPCVRPPKRVEQQPEQEEAHDGPD